MSARLLAILVALAACSSPADDWVDFPPSDAIWYCQAPRGAMIGHEAFRWHGGGGWVGTHPVAGGWLSAASMPVLEAYCWAGGWP